MKYTNVMSTGSSEVSIDMGTITGWSNTVQKRGSGYPIVTQGMQNTFPIENGNSQSYTFNFTHYNGQNGETNAAWYAKVTACMDRWQARTNGCNIVYTPDADNPYAEALDLEGYIKSITRNYSNEFNEVITGSIEFVVGTMHVDDDPPAGAESYGGMYIIMSDSEQTNWYALYYGCATGDANTYEYYNCIDSVTISGGPESPFEYAIIRMPKKKLMEQIPNLYGDIKNYRNRIFMKLMGNHDMFVQQMDDSSNTITIKAYTNAQMYRNKVTEMTYSGRPLDIMNRILTDASFGYSIPVANIMCYYSTDNNSSVLSIPSGTQVYRALQICASMLGCRLFFADDCAYIVDYRTPIGSMTSTNGLTIMSAGSIDIRDSATFGARVFGDSECDPIGFDPVKNFARYKASDETTQAVQIKESFNEYGTLDKGMYDLPELTEDQCVTFCKNRLTYLCEPQRAMTFNVKEKYARAGQFGGSWASYFGVCARADTITDSSNKETVNNLTDLKAMADAAGNYDIYSQMIRAAGGRMYHKLALSEYTRTFPDGTCKYTFGIIASVELSDNLSQTSNTLNA